MEETRTFAPLLIVILLAFVVPMFLTRLRRFRLPIVVGEIMAGILIGRSGLGWVQHHDPVLDLLADFGFVFLMFLAGMEIDFSSLGLFSNTTHVQKQNHRWGPIPLGGLHFSLTLGLSLLAAYALQLLGLTKNPLLMALILSTTSLGVVVPVLKERGLNASPLGQNLLISALIADFATMLLITLDVAILSSGLTLEILLVGVLFVAFFLIYRFGNFFFNRLPAVRRVLEDLSQTTAQIKVRAAFSIMLVFVVLAEALGAEVILGAFLAGAIVALLRSPQESGLTHQLDTIGYGFFIPIFFIMVGVDFNLAGLLGSTQAMLLVPLLLVLAIGVKIFPALVFRTRFSWRETLASGALLSARLSLIIAASAIGVRLHVINEATNAAIILVAALTSTLAPFIFNQLMSPEDDRKKRRVLIFGAANLGVQVAKELQAHGEQIYFLEPDPKLVKLVRKEGFHVIQGEADSRSLEQAQLCDSDTVLALSGDDEKNYWLASQAVGCGLTHVVALVNEPTRAFRFRELGVHPFVPAMYRATLLALMARNPDLFRLLTSTTDERDIREINMLNPNLEGKALSNLVLPGDSLILAVSRDGVVLIPHGSTRLEWADRLSILGDIPALQDVQFLLEG